MAFSIIGLLIPLLLTVLPIVVGIIMIVVARRHRRAYPSCGACRYDLSGSIGTAIRCPECGAAFADVGVLPPSRMTDRRPLFVTGIILVVFPLLCGGSGVIVSYISYVDAQQARARAATAQQQALQLLQQVQQTAANATPAGDSAESSEGDPADDVVDEDPETPD